MWRAAAPRQRGHRTERHIGFISVKTIYTNVNHIAQTPVDDQFSAMTKMPEHRHAIERTTSVPA